MIPVSQGDSGLGSLESFLFVQHPGHVVRLPWVIVGTALIFEGGGMRASYTSGMVVALLEAGIRFDWVGGISAGATNLCNYLSDDAWRARQSFTDFAADPQFGGWGSFARGRGYFHADYIYRHTSGADQALPFDWSTFQANPAQFRLGAFNIRTGRTEYWGREDIHDVASLMVRVQASSSIPVMMPAVQIEGETYLDGALGATGGFALDAARRDGYERFVVVLSQPRAFVKRPHAGGELWAVARQYRRHPTVVRAVRHRADNYNRTRRQLLALEAAGKAHLFFPETMPVGTGERRLPRLRASHDAGLAQARSQLPALREFLDS